MMITNFSSGELSPTLNGRTDIPQYFAGVGNLLNFDVIPTGGLKRRVGTQRVAKLESNSRLIPFIINENISFILQVIPVALGSKIVIWQNDKKEINGVKKWEKVINTEWNSLSEINEIQYAQNYDRLILVQRNHNPFIITYDVGTNSFTSGNMQFDFTPDIKLDDDYGVVGYVTGQLPLLPYEQNGKIYYHLIFEQELYIWNGTKYEKQEASDEFKIDDTLFTTENKYPSAVAFFNGRLYFAATNNDRQKVWSSAAPNLQGNRYTDFSTYVKYITVNKVIKDPDIHFFTADATESSDTLTNVTQNLTLRDKSKTYYVTGPYIPEGTKVVEATWNKEEQKGTLKLSAPIAKAATTQMFSIQTWVNRTQPSDADYEYKVLNNNMVNPDNSFFFELASDQNDGIKWLAASSYLIIGTETATYVMNPQSSALMQNVIMNGRHGTDSLQATVVDNAVVYFGNGKRGIREYYWNQEQNGFRSNNLAILSPQMLEESPAVDFDFRAYPTSTILITRADGILVKLLYDKNVGVQAWSRVELNAGRIQSVAVIRGDEGIDQVFFIVEREGSYYLEKYDESKKVYLDSWSIYKGEEIRDYENYTLYDATSHKDVTNDDAIFNDHQIYIGYKYTSTVTSMPIVKQDVTSKKRITSLITRFYNSYMPILVVGDKKEIYTDIKEPYSGLKEIVYPGESKRDVTFTLSIEKPEACNILAINANLD